jgi:acyl-CoA thioester hydrolase
MTVVRHQYSCPLRWADLDLLGHVNNVRYVDYLRAGRDALMADAGVDLGSAGLLVRRHELTFRAPLKYSRTPITVESVIIELGADGAVLEQAIIGNRPAGTIHLRARTWVSARDDQGEARPFTAAELSALSPYVESGDPLPEKEPVRVRSADERRYAMQVRAGDVDVTGHASDVALVEFFQEARIGFFGMLMRDGTDNDSRVRWVVAQADVDYLRPLELRPTPYDCFTRLAKVGHKSLTLDAVIRDDTGADLATGRFVIVVFDPVTNRSVEPPEGYRELLETFVTVD